MIYLFCSASRPLYKRDALESTCYPLGYLFRFRYEKRYVEKNIWLAPQSYTDKEGIIVFVDTVGENAKKDFEFYPIRKIRTTRLFTEGMAIYVDFKFGKFIDYGDEEKDEKSSAWDKYFRELANRPWPPPERSGRSKELTEGYFLVSDDANCCDFGTESVIPYQSWEWLIKRLDRSNDLRNSTFFQILGFYHVERSGLIFKSYKESPIAVRDNSYYSFYSLPAGKSIILKVLLSRPSYRDAKEARRRLDIRFSPEAFIGISKKEIYSESRYNEENVVFVCKRTHDPILSSVSFEQRKEKKTIQAPKPFILTQIEVPPSIVSSIIVGSIAGAALLGLDSDSIATIGSWISKYLGCGTFIVGNAKTLSVFAKMISGILVSLCAYWAFRKLPMK